MKKPIEQDISIIIKTFERDHCVNRLYYSIRKLYPNITILIADDSKNPQKHLGDAKIIALPYNVGLSHGRNILLGEVLTKYFVMLDDDFVFTKDTDLSVPHNILETTDFDMVGIKLLDYGWKRRIYRGCYEISASKLWQFQGQSYASYKGYPAYHYVLNCFMAKTETIKASPWDEAIKIGHEHDDFFLRLKGKKALITHTDEISIDHYPEMTGDYKEIRESTDTFKQIFYEKHQITGIKEIGKGFPYWQRKLDSFLKFINIRNIVNNLIRKNKLKRNGLEDFL